MVYDGQVKTEQEQWEEARVKTSIMHFGAKDKRAEDTYELLVEDQIEFISHELMKGEVLRFCRWTQPERGRADSSKLTSFCADSPQ